MLKESNKSHSDLLQSYHIEVMALKIFSENITDYSWAVFSYFDQAATLAAAPLAYDGGYADDYLDWNARTEVVKEAGGSP